MSGRLALAALLAALPLAGCGDPDLWARWRAERGFWEARREIAKIEVQPRLAKPADFARAAAKFQRVVDAFPAAVWAAPAALRRPLARDVALLAGRAALAVARVRESEGALDAALGGYRAAARDYAALPELAIEAQAAHAAALDRAGRTSEAVAAYLAIAAAFAPVDPATGVARPAVLDAPLLAAERLELLGRAEAADSVLRAAEGAARAALEGARGRAAAAEIAPRLARVRVALGRTEEALAALREALPEAAAAGGRSAVARTVIAMGELALEGGRPDSTFAYARWAADGFDARTGAAALTLEARAWERTGPPDSALAAWRRFLERFPGTVDGSTRARFQRARLFETLGRWEHARGEYRALIAADPTHDLAFAALRRIVDWHSGRGEMGLAQLEGERGVEALDRLIALHRDERVQHLARRTRAELLFAIEAWTPACSAFSDLWNRYGDGGSGLRAADVAESRLRDPERARELYRDLADRAPGDAERQSARDALVRLEQRGQG